MGKPKYISTYIDTRTHAPTVCVYVLRCGIYIGLRPCGKYLKKQTWEKQILLFFTGAVAYWMTDSPTNAKSEYF